MAYFDQNAFNAALAMKYRIMQQEANAKSTDSQAGLISAQSGANLANVRAGLLPAESASNIANQSAQTAGLTETNKYIGPLAQSQIGLQRANARQSIAQGGMYDSISRLNAIDSNQSPFEAYMRQLGLRPLSQ